MAYTFLKEFAGFACTLINLNRYKCIHVNKVPILALVIYDIGQCESTVFKIHIMIYFKNWPVRVCLQCNRNEIICLSFLEKSFVLRHGHNVIMCNSERNRMFVRVNYLILDFSIDKRYLKNIFLETYTNKIKKTIFFKRNRNK